MIYIYICVCSISREQLPNLFHVPPQNALKWRWVVYGCLKIRDHNIATTDRNRNTENGSCSSENRIVGGPCIIWVH